MTQPEQPTADLQLPREAAIRLLTRTFDGRSPFTGDALFTDEALTLIGAALTILANVLAHQEIPVGSPVAPPAGRSDPTQLKGPNQP